MNGAIIPHTPIAVDFWNTRETAAKHCRLFFLSHAHADHTVGLSSSWKNHKIYCTDLTKRIILHKLGICEDLVVGLPLNQPFVIPMDEVGLENLTVTLIDANHCPGAVLFLFQGYFGNILYTGDFRYYTSLSSHHALQNIVIDKLYLDNTYCDPKCVFPTREDAMDMVLEVVRKHLDFNIFFGMNTLGKEDLMAKIAITFKEWIGVDYRRMNLLKLLDLPDVFTCENIESVGIRIVMKSKITKTNLQVWNRQHPTIAILPTALFEGEKNIYQNMENVFVIPFSDHSSFTELMAFVSEIRPKEIVPLVLRHRSGKGDPHNVRANMTVFNTLLNKEPLTTFTIPETVLQFMGARTTVHKLKRRIRSISAPKQKRHKCSGVVFSDEEEDKDSISVHSSCSGVESDKHGHETDGSRKTDITLEPLNHALNNELTSVPEDKEAVAIKQEVTLEDECTNADIDSNIKEPALEMVDIGVGLTGALKREEDIDVDEGTPLYDVCGTEVMNIICTCKCKRENDKDSRMLFVLKQEEDSTDSNERRIILPNLEQEEHEKKQNSENKIIPGFSNGQTRSSLTITKTSELTSEDAETMTNGLTEDHELAQRLLEAFNSGNYEDEYTVGNPVYKKFVGHFCRYLKTVTSEAMLEAKENDNNSKYPLSCSSRMREDTNTDGSHASYLRKHSDFIVEDDDDSEDESDSGFNWFSSE